MRYTIWKIMAQCVTLCTGVDERYKTKLLRFFENLRLDSLVKSLILEYRNFVNRRFREFR
jgi:hypothetical protein